MIRLKKPAIIETIEVKKNESESTAIENGGKLISNAGNENDDKKIAEENGLKLFGIGGVSVRSGSSKKVGKKKTPGEIRIQKGNSNDF
jgi:hypothetical protein